MLWTLGLLTCIAASLCLLNRVVHVLLVNGTELFVYRVFVLRVSWCVRLLLFRLVKDLTSLPKF